MKNKILCKILAFVMLTILFVQFALTIVVFAKDEVSIEYSNVWIDLEASSVFNAENHVQRYPSNPNDYKLEVISIAESEGGGGGGESAQHTTVTVFEADSVRNGLPFDYAEYLLKNESNIEMDLDVDTKQENPKLETAYGETFATASKEEFSKDSIPQPKNQVNRKYSISEEYSSDSAYLTAVEHTVGTGVLDRPKKREGSAKNNAPKSGRYLLISFGDQITRTRRTASRAVRSASAVAGTAPVTSKMV